METINNQPLTDQNVPISPTDALAGGISQLMHECEHNGQEDYERELEAMNSILRKSTLILTDEDEKKVNKVSSSNNNSRQSLRSNKSGTRNRGSGDLSGSIQLDTGDSLLSRSLSSSRMSVGMDQQNKSKVSVQTNASAVMDVDENVDDDGDDEDDDGYMDEDEDIEEEEEDDGNSSSDQSSISSASSAEQLDDNGNVDMDIADSDNDNENENDNGNYNRGSNRSLSSIDSNAANNTGGLNTFERVESSGNDVLESTTDTKLVKTNSDGRRPKRTKREKMAPVDIVWEQGGQNVFVTGTFTGWTKMIRMLHTDNKPNVFHVRLKLPPGTHRFRFVVDNELRFSDFLPTATDQMGNFVNYVEVRPSDVIHADEYSGSEMERTGETAAEMAQIKKMSTRSRIALKIKHEPDNLSDGFTKFHEEPPKRAPLQYSSRLPAIFTDPRLMEQYYIRLHRERGSHQSTHLLPPQLPSQLEYVVLNDYPCTPGDTQTAHGGALPTPNHVVLHHLITSNIKHNTLGIATVVRYRDKYMTQIYYTPIDRAAS